MAEELKERPRIKGAKEARIEEEQKKAPQVIVYDPNGVRGTADAANVPDLVAAGWSTDRPTGSRVSRTVVKSLIASSEAPGAVQSLDSATATGDTGTGLDQPTRVVSPGAGSPTGATTSTTTGGTTGGGVSTAGGSVSTGRGSAAGPSAGSTGGTGGAGR